MGFQGRSGSVHLYWYGQNNTYHNLRDGGFASDRVCGAESRVLTAGARDAVSSLASFAVSGADAIAWHRLAIDNNVAIPADPQTITGTRVAVFGVGRSHNANRIALDRTTVKQIRSFWTNAFETMGAKSITITKQLRIEE